MGAIADPLMRNAVKKNRKKPSMAQGGTDKKEVFAAAVMPRRAQTGIIFRVL